MDLVNVWKADGLWRGELLWVLVLCMLLMWREVVLMMLERVLSRMHMIAVESGIDLRAHVYH